MNAVERKPWTRDELLLAVNCELPCPKKSFLLRTNEAKKIVFSINLHLYLKKKKEMNDSVTIN